MKAKLELVLILFLTGVVGCSSISPRVVLKSSLIPANYRALHDDSNYQFGLEKHRDGVGDMEVVVFSKARNEWKSIRRVSLAGARLGRGSYAAQIDLNFARIYKGCVTAPLPLQTGLKGVGGFTIVPDGVVFDSNGQVYRFYFLSDWHDDSMRTMLVVQKSDLDKAFKIK